MLKMRNMVCNFYIYYLSEHKRPHYERRPTYKRSHGNKRTDYNPSPEETLHNLIFLVGQKVTILCDQHM